VVWSSTSPRLWPVCEFNGSHFSSVLNIIHSQPAFSAPYNASKSALSSLTDALDMELRPFNVRVMLLSTGMVRSRIASNYESHIPALAPDSPYHLYMQNIKERLQISQDVCMDTEVFAKRVVKEALRTTPTRYLKLGGNSITTSIVECLPRGLRLWIFWKALTKWKGLLLSLIKTMSRLG
jgi:short-subunit dehydrogenase